MAERTAEGIIRSGALQAGSPVLRVEKINRSLALIRATIPSQYNKENPIFEPGVKDHDRPKFIELDALMSGPGISAGPSGGDRPHRGLPFYHGPGVRFQIPEPGRLPAIFGVSLQMVFGMKLHSAGVAHPGNE